ncbi:MAG: hypothetical protein KKD69_07260 [Euryarchaeota archaeon]|nr:hypothetical protein [Euryarchaeota archaeon]MCG2727055.1 hypothetical protein [Candidatus Methanoperedenaceae archaeon]
MISINNVFKYKGIVSKEMIIDTLIKTHLPISTVNYRTCPNTRAPPLPGAPPEVRHKPASVCRWTAPQGSDGVNQKK